MSQIFLPNRFSDPCYTLFSELQTLVRRDSSTIHDTTSHITSTAILPSSLSTPTPSSTDPDTVSSAMHSPVPIVAGALVGLIAILAATITVIVLRRKKQRAVSRRAVIHSPTTGSTVAFDSGTILLQFVLFLSLDG